MLVIRTPIGLKKIRSVLVRLAIEALERKVTLRSCVEYVHSLLRHGRSTLSTALLSNWRPCWSGSSYVYRLTLRSPVTD